MSEVKSRKAQQSEQTRKHLVQTARTLFGEKGYGAAGTEEIVRAAGVTRGALYHHFRDKRELFLAVYEDLERELTDKLAQTLAGETDPSRMLVRGCDAFLDACLDPEVRRITLLDAPAVLGWQAWREVEAKYGLGLLRAALTIAMQQGVVTEQPIKPLSHLLLGALSEAALVVAHADDVEAARAEVGRSCRLLVEGLGHRG